VKREHHLVDGRRRDLEVRLQLGLRRGSAVDLGVVVDEREILALLGGEAPRDSTYHWALAPVAMPPGTSSEYAENPRRSPKIPHLSRSIGGEYRH